MYCADEARAAASSSLTCSMLTAAGTSLRTWTPWRRRIGRLRRVVLLRRGDDQEVAAFDRRLEGRELLDGVVAGGEGFHRLGVGIVASGQPDARTGGIDRRHLPAAARDADDADPQLLRFAISACPCGRRPAA